MKPETQLLINLASTLFLTGLAWFLQVVHLPLLCSAGRLDFIRYITSHRVRNTALMIVPMLAEAYTAGGLWWNTPEGYSGANLFRALLLLIVIWIVTFAWHMPQYRNLVDGYDEDAIRKLIRSNAVRTICWTGRSALMLWITADRLRI